MNIQLIKDKKFVYLQDGRCFEDSSASLALAHSHTRTFALSYRALNDTQYSSHNTAH
jgi:hypothetical protein